MRRLGPPQGGYPRGIPIEVNSSAFMEPLYQEDLAYIQAAAFGEVARGAAPAIVQCLQSAAIPITRVVEAGCGAGPLTSALIESGFDVTAIDASAELLQIARKAAPRAHCIPGSIYGMALPVCEAIIALGETLTYHAELEKADDLVRGFFRRASEALPRGGLLIFDVIEAGEPSLSGRSWSAGDDWAVLVESDENQSTRSLVRSIETFRKIGSLYRRVREVHKVRLFETETLLGQLTFAGFATETAQFYGAQVLLPRRRAFFATRIA